MTRKFKFYIDDIVSDIYEYDTDDFIDDDDLIQSMEIDRQEFIYSNIDTGYVEIKD